MTGTRNRYSRPASSPPLLSSLTPWHPLSPPSEESCRPSATSRLPPFPVAMVWQRHVDGGAPSGSVRLRPRAAALSRRQDCMTCVLYRIGLYVCVCLCVLYFCMIHKHTHYNRPVCKYIMQIYYVTHIHTHTHTTHTHNDSLGCFPRSRRQRLRSSPRAGMASTRRNTLVKETY